MQDKLRSKKGIGTVIGAIMFIAIIMFAIINLTLWTSRTGIAMTQIDMQRTEEYITFTIKPLTSRIQLNFTNRSPRMVYIVALWLINSTGHYRYTTAIPISVGNASSPYYISHPTPGNRKVTIKAITELGRIFINSSTV